LSKNSQIHELFAVVVSPTITAMTDTANLLRLAGAHMLKNYKQPPLVMTRGEGCRLWDTEGRQYLDMYAGIAVCALGHAHPALVKAISEQAARLGHIANYYYNDRQIELSAELSRRTGFERVFLCNSGTEANEAALKLARRYHYTRGDKVRTEVVATWSSFHGRSMGALALTGQAKYWEGFGHMIPGVSHVAYGDLEAMRRRISDRTAAVFVEPVQGEGGVLPAPAGYLAGLSELCRERGALLCVDEIQTGIGRTGKFLAIQHDQVMPDVVTIAKGTAGGVPIGAMLVREQYGEALAPGTHGSTFGGNPLSAAAALAVLRTLDEQNLLAHAHQAGNYFVDGLSVLARKYPQVATGARGRGLLVGLVLAESVDPRQILTSLRERGVLVSQAGERVIRFAPALIVTHAEIDECLRALDAVLAEISAQGRL
jgi:acetylornithine/N-succinyldiaminopimelate aminotransferase